MCAVKRLVNGLLILLVLGTVVLGAYAIGKRVDTESTGRSSGTPSSPTWIASTTFSSPASARACGSG